MQPGSFRIPSSGYELLETPMTASRDEEFRAFVRERRADLLRTAILLTAGDRHLAEDLTQTTLAALYVKWPIFQQARNRAGYVRRCLVNALIDEKRRPWRRERTVDEIPDSLIPDRYLPFDDVQTDLRTDALYGALRALPPRMRAVLVLRYFHELSVEETAEALSCSTGTVKSQSKRAIDKLRHVMSVELSSAPIAPGGRDA
jgi:RNA polymerase sigma-70 factor (sigma-E family)